MIYLDHAATTPLDPRVLEAMLPWLTERFGNPSSIHACGRQARIAVDAARDAVARTLACDYGEVLFTSGGTEADNLAVAGAALAAPQGRDHVVVSAIEHHAVLHSARALARRGFTVTTLEVDAEGRAHPDALAEAITDRTALVSVMHASNEVGTVQDVARLAAVAHARGALFHTDAVQSYGSLPTHVRGMDCDLLSLSAHKLYGPKGVGALYVRAGVRIEPLTHGGAQERERRPGTENVAGIVGLGRAAELAADTREEEAARLTALRDAFIDAVLGAVEGARLNGPRQGRLPNNVNVSIAGVDGAAMLVNLDRAGIAASSGSACSSGAIEPSHVLLALGQPRDVARGGLRFTLGRSSTQADLDATVDALAGIVARIRR